MLSFRFTFKSPFLRMLITISYDRPGCACSAFVRAVRSVCDAAMSRRSNYFRSIDRKLISKQCKITFLHNNFWVFARVKTRKLWILWNNTTFCLLVTILDAVKLVEQASRLVHHLPLSSLDIIQSYATRKFIIANCSFPRTLFKSIKIDAFTGFCSLNFCSIHM